MTPEQYARFNAGNAAQLSLFDASMMAHDCAMIGITTDNNTLLETAEDIGRRLRHENGSGPIDPVEVDNLYACALASVDAVMCSLPPNHPARQIDDEARRAMLHKEQVSPCVPLVAQIPQTPPQSNSIPARIPRARRLSPCVLVRRTRLTLTTTVIQ